jgi:2-oxoglutarate ferredoxin oxidoreductase subunit alpha
MTASPSHDERPVLISGNEAAGEGALCAGCRFYAGYPITPQNELTAHMAARMPQLGGVFIQAESELAAVNMVYGASAAGARAMTSSSSPGISLKLEGISYLAGSELPALIVNMQRGGPGLGDIRPAQGDYFQATKGGGHGDYHCIVLAPAGAQEAADLAYLGFELSDKWRVPVIVLGDGYVGQMMEPVRFDHLTPPERPARPWALTGAKGRKQNIVKSFYSVKGALEAFNIRLKNRYDRIAREEVRYELVGEEEPEVLIIAFGIAARICREVVVLEKEAVRPRTALLRPITLWPFPTDAVRDLAERVDSILVVEMNHGQMVEDVRLAVEGRCPVYFHGRAGGAVPNTADIVEILNG